MRPESGFWIAPNWPQIRKITMKAQFRDTRHRQIFFVCLVMLSYWSKFHVNVITVSKVMTIFFNKG